MVILYECRHCKTNVGELNHKGVTSDQLGLHHLSEDERQDMIEYSEDGTMLVKTICEDCHDALIRNPDYHALYPFIQ